MNNMFCNSKFDQDISQWDVINVKEMGEMFEFSVFNGDLTKWNVYIGNIFKDSKSKNIPYWAKIDDDDERVNKILNYKKTLKEKLLLEN